jgi:putative tryptophan/tyrosine transport system substrate-binding protein
VWSLAASAQQKPVIGLLNSGSADAYRDRITAFQQGLRQLGYIDGENVIVDYRWALRLKALRLAKEAADKERTG